jgi:hypothetical protein
MKRELLRSRALALALGGALLGAAAWWFSQNFGFTERDEYVGLSGEARVNPYFAAKLLLERMGLRVQQKVDMARPETLADGATLVLAARRDDIDPPTLDALLAWVERGGHLIVGVETVDEHDPLLPAIRVQAYWPQVDEPRDEPAAARPPAAAGGEQPARQSSTDTLEEVVLENGRALRMRPVRGPLLADLQEDSIWSHDTDEGARILAVAWGEGRITLFSTLRPFDNTRIGALDHAELLWQIVAPARGPELYLVRHLETASLPRWLLQHAPLALAAAAVFIALWLWRVMLRFGPLVPAASHDRRSLLEHLRAVGRYYAGARQQSRLLALLRADCLALFGRLAPLAHGLEGAARLREASRLTRINPRELLHAFSGAAASRNDFFHMVRTLARFRRRLTRRA